MRYSACLLLVLFVILPDAQPQNVNTERPVEVHPPNQASGRLPHADPVQLQNDARELAALAATIPGDMDRVNQGLFPKDVNDKLKRIERLSKRLRSSVAQ